jgi:polyisoprenyl-phosphate glycosyltransferase
MAEISVVVPVYGCADCLRALHERLTASLQKLTRDYELVFVDDRSADNAWEVLCDLAANDPAVRAIRLSRNFGQHPAITAGLAEATGRWVIVTDCDLEDPPEEISRLWAKAQEGYDVVLSRRRRRHQSFRRRVGARGYRALANMLAGTDVDPELTNLSIISRQVADEFLRLRDQDRQYILILVWLGFKHAVVEVEQDERHAGESSYTFRELIRVAADGIFFQTTKLLRWIVYAGFTVAVLGAILALLLVYNYTQRNPPTGYTSLAVLLLIVGGAIIATVGVMGLYIGKIFGQVKGRPLYVIDERLGDDQDGAQAEAEASVAASRAPTITR